MIKKLAALLIFASLNFSMAEQNAKPLGDREKKQLLKQHYKMALEAYARRDFASAINHWTEILGVDPSQESAKDMIEKVKEEKTQFNKKKQGELADLTKKGRYAEARDVAKILAANEPDNLAYQEQLKKLDEQAKAEPQPEITTLKEEKPKEEPKPIQEPLAQKPAPQKPCPPASCPSLKITQPSDCLELTANRDGKKESLGCYYVSETAKAKGNPALLIYLRGWHPGLGKSVPPVKRLESSRLDFKRYALHNAAESNGLALIVTGSNDISVLPGDVAELEERLKLKFSQVFLAVQGGGYVGLKETLPHFKKIDRLIMLDSFYFGPQLAKSIKKWINNGTACAGFYTKHNKARYEKVFKGLSTKCPVELHEEIYPRGHNESVSACLSSYISSTRCP